MRDACVTSCVAYVGAFPPIICEAILWHKPLGRGYNRGVLPHPNVARGECGSANTRFFDRRDGCGSLAVAPSLPRKCLNQYPVSVRRTPVQAEESVQAGFFYRRARCLREQFVPGTECRMSTWKAVDKALWMVAVVFGFPGCGFVPEPSSAAAVCNLRSRSGGGACSRWFLIHGSRAMLLGPCFLGHGTRAMVLRTGGGIGDHTIIIHLPWRHGRCT